MTTFLRSRETFWPKGRRGGAFVLADAFIIAGSMCLAFLLRFDGAVPPHYLNMLKMLIPLALGLKLPFFLFFRVYHLSWAYVGLEDLLNVALACGVGSLAFAALLFLLHRWPAITGFPRSTLAMDFVLTLLGVSGVRLTKRTVSFLYSRKRALSKAKRALIVGAGEAGEQLVRSLLREQGCTYWPIAFLDDDPAKHGLRIHGVPVLGTRSRLPEVVRRHEVNTVLMAMPSAHPRVIRETVELARRAGVKEIKILPSLSELYTGEVRVSESREVRPEDVLPREPVSVDFAALDRFLKGKRVLVTGAAGSIGSELCKQVLRFSPAALAGVDFDETGLFLLDQELARLFPNQNFQVIVADVRDRTKILRIFGGVRPQIVLHAAAYKHVPMMEAFPEEAIKTNVFGTKVVVEAACQTGAEMFVLISTDKAVNPISVMGMTKRLAELVTLSAAQGSKTVCIAVRFGNVLGSRGSVIPIFLDQIRRGGPVTVTHPDMERYFMTISEAVLLVLQAAAMGKGGEVFVLDMGQPMRIVDIAKELIRFHGLEPDKDIPIVFTGIRPGEKLKEEILTAEEGTEVTKHKQIYVAKMVKKLPPEVLEAKLKELAELLDQWADGNKIKEVLAEIIYGEKNSIAGQEGV
ncbi:MAG: nucleoside-diphosphate sugar epimerase/dehydratase [Candidatus Methanomethyliaceae archaeon]